MDLLKIVQAAPKILTIAWFLSIFFAVWFYGSVARRGIPKIGFWWRLLIKLGLGVLVFLLAKGLVRYNFYNPGGLMSILIDPLVSFGAGTIIALFFVLGFFLFFREERKETAKGPFLKRILQDPKKIAGSLILIFIITASLTGFMIPKRAGVLEEIPGVPSMANILQKEDPNCLKAKSIIDVMRPEQVFGSEVREYKKPENLAFMVTENPRFKIKTSTIAETVNGNYVLVTMTEDKYETGGVPGPEELLTLKFCSVRATDYKLCDCSGILGMADKLVGLLAKNTELTPEMQQIKGVVDMVSKMKSGG